MLGLGWTEMLVIGVVALIVIGPKDLPVVMNRIGKVVGQIRRMGSEFQREINKTTGLDEVRNLRNSITAPLKKTSEEIRKEFNTITPTGVKPSGVIKPADPKAESVVDEIRAAAGVTPAKPAAPVPTAPKAAPVKAARKAPAKPRSPAKAKAVPVSTVTSSDLPAVEEAPPAEYVPVDVTARRKPRKAPAKPVPVLPTEPADSPATKTPRARAPRKPAAPKAESK